MTDLKKTSPDSDNPAVEDDKSPEQIRIRKEKRERLLEKAAGNSRRDPYPVVVPRTHTLREIIDNSAYDSLEPGAESTDYVTVAGRVLFVRNTGRLCFARLQEGVTNDTAAVTKLGEAAQLQVMLSEREVGKEELGEWKTDVDLGDFVYVSGRVCRSKRGELSVMATEWAMASKAIRPLPVAHKEMSEDTRIRRRYTDLVMREEARRNAIVRIKVVCALRHALERRGFLEVETPMLQTLHGGAAARPFVTHSNALDIDLYLRIAPELYLKRCVVGGLERVFEINRNFRNEGVDSSHSPEFAMLETYQAYGTYDDAARMMREVIQEIAEEVFGSTTVTLADGTEYDFGGDKWESIEMYPSLNEALHRKFPETLDMDITVDTSVGELEDIAKLVGLDVPEDAGWLHGKLVEELWEHLCGDQLEGPIFVRNFPVETSPLTRDHRSERGITEKWDLYVRGFELATAYSELVDPVIQRERFVDQARLAAAGDDEAMVLDEDFLEAMEQGMPPTCGIGMGIDRLLMALTGLGIRETVLFPIVKPEHKN